MKISRTPKTDRGNMPGGVSCYARNVCSGNWLDKKQTAGLAVNTGSIRLNFIQPGSCPLYALRWEGDHEAELQALVGAGKLAWAPSRSAARSKSTRTRARRTSGLPRPAARWSLFGEEGDHAVPARIATRSVVGKRR
jgi:hypothetical protein